MYYKFGEIVELGDRVIIDDGKTPGIVHAIIESDKDMEQWGVSEAGILLESKVAGLIFLPISDDDTAILVCRLVV